VKARRRKAGLLVKREHPGKMDKKQTGQIEKISKEGAKA